MIILKIPFDEGNLKIKGGKLAPGIISNFFENEQKIEEVLPEKLNIEETHKRIYEKSKELFKKDFIFSIGGDHSISYPLITAFLENFPSAVILYIDAHADADVIIEPPTYEDLIKVLFEKRILDNSNFCYIGLSKVFENEKKFIEKNKIRCFSPLDIKGIKEFISSREIYISLDIDVFAKAKATGHPDGKAETSEIINLLKELKEKTASMDLVEFNPEIEDKHTSKIAKEIVEIYD